MKKAYRFYSRYSSHFMTGRQSGKVKRDNFLLLFNINTEGILYYRDSFSSYINLLMGKLANSKEVYTSAVSYTAM